MEHLTVELVLSILLAFFVGCILGCLLRQALSGRATAEMAAAGAAAPAGEADETALAAVMLPQAPVVVAEEAGELAALDMLAEPPAGPPDPPEWPAAGPPVRWHSRSRR